MQDAHTLAQAILQKDSRALARGISWLEDGPNQKDYQSQQPIDQFQRHPNLPVWRRRR